VGRITQHYLDKPEPATRHIDSVECMEENGLLRIVVREKYSSLEGTLTWILGRNGVSTFNYEYAFTQKEFDVPTHGGATTKAPFKNISENGLVFTFPQSFDKLAWEKDLLWGAAPDWHIGRPKGTANPYYTGSAQDRPWQLDETELGTADFRSSKYKIRRVSLNNADGQCFIFEGDGTSHARAALAGDKTQLRIFNRTAEEKGEFTIQP